MADEAVSAGWERLNGWHGRGLGLGWERTSIARRLAFVIPAAAKGARGFVGVAFRIDENGRSFSCEGLYIRPTNGRAQDQVRRNRSTQYFSYPGYDFDHLRREAPGQYESYADLVPGEWTHLRIEVSGANAQLYVGASGQPVLIVHDLKRGSDAHGTVGLFVGNGTDGHFRNLSIRPQ